MMRRGFSLIELSIVLVILGLLVGGILAGQSLIHAAELRSVTVQVEQYRTSLSAFRDKYFALPGDFSNAFSFWGTNCAATAGACNGDGNGNFDSGTEAWMAWRHLGLAGLVGGNYTGTIPGGIPVQGVNIPATRVNGGGLSFRYAVIGATTFYNFIQFGTFYPSILYNLDGVVISGVDGYTMDVKTDDGKAPTGRMRAGVGWGGTGPCLSSGDYALTDNLPSCRIFFLVP